MLSLGYKGRKFCSRGEGISLMESSKRQIFLLRDFRILLGFCAEIDGLGLAYHMLTVRLLQVEHS